MTLSTAEVFLLVWAMLMTFLYVASRHNASRFKRFTVYKLQQVASGKAKIVDDGESISIVDC